MARGWESKAIESQQEDRESAAAAKKGPALTPEEAKHESRRQTLTVALARAQADLAIAHHPDSTHPHPVGRGISKMEWKVSASAEY